MPRRANEAAARPNAPAYPARWLVPCRLAGGEACVGRLQPMTGRRMPALPQHRARRGKSLVEIRRDARSNFHALAQGPAARRLDARSTTCCDKEPRP